MIYTPVLLIAGVAYEGAVPELIENVFKSETSCNLSEDLIANGVVAYPVG